MLNSPSMSEGTPPGSGHNAPPGNGRSDYSQPNAGGAAGSPGMRPKHSVWFWMLMIGGTFAALVLVFSVLVWFAVRSTLGGDSGFADLSPVGSSKIAVVDLSGVILSADTVDQQLRKFADDNSVKAIILHVNSPGGGAAASQEIYNEVRRIRDVKKKRIVASVESVGASGAYYIASGTNRIYANDASIVGSIGVIMEWVNYGDLMHWAKLKNVIIKAGELKDAGTPTRDLTPQEQAYFQGLVDNMHTQFIRDVATGRGVSFDKIKAIANGQVWTGQQALPLGLIDQSGGFRVALMDTAKAVGIQGEPTIVRPSKPKVGLLTLLDGDAESLFPNPEKLLEQAPGFYFMWK